MIRSKLTARAQTTIPRPVRVALDLGPGDEVTYEIEGERVILRKLGEVPVDDPFAAFAEWDGEADRKAHDDLYQGDVDRGRPKGG
jgi:antitoxin PrlF